MTTSNRALGRSLQGGRPSAPVRSLRSTFAILLALASAQSTASQAQSDASAVDFRWGVKVPMRDAVALNATVYLPRGQKAPAPCVLTITPYIADTYHDRGVFFAAHGLPFLTIDARGRGNSGGVFAPFIQEAKDGYDAIEWLARQPYCNGKVAMWGGSYAGYGQWAAAKELPPHLATIVPAAAPFMGLEFPMRNNIFMPYQIQWLTYTSGKAGQASIFADQSFWSAMWRRWYEGGGSLASIDHLVGNPSPIFQQWLAHPAPDHFWDAFNPTNKQYGEMTLPVLTITGSNDDDQPGALEHYRRLMRYASPDVRARQYLVIGPWDHAGTRTPMLEFGGVTTGRAAMVDLPQLHLDWYAWIMGQGRKPAFLEKPVAYYVAGAERWRYADNLDGITARAQPFFLSSRSNADDVLTAGSLEPNKAVGGPDFYRFDPAERHDAYLDAEAGADASSLVDQRMTFALRGAELVYHSAPFERDTEVSGFLRLVAWLAIDRPDTDFYASVYDIAPDGTSVRMSTDAMRARYREDIRTAKLVRTTAPLRYSFDHFTFVSRVVRAGHRLRLVLAPMGRLVQATFAEKNYNNGGQVAQETVEDARAVTVRLYHDASHTSALYVPIGKAEPATVGAPNSDGSSARVVP